MRVLTWVSAALALLCLDGCALNEPYVQPGTWRPTNSPDANIAAQAVRASDLVSGVPYAPVSEANAASAVNRWRRDQVRTLPQSGLSRIGSSGSGQQQSSGEQNTGTAGGGTP